MSQTQATSGSGGASSTSQALTMPANTLHRTGFFLLGTDSNCTITVATDNTSGGALTWVIKSDGGKSHCVYRLDLGNGATTLNLTFSIAVGVDFQYFERDDILGFDQFTAQTIATTDPWVTATSAAMAQNNEIGFCWACSPNNSGLYSGATSPWTPCTASGTTNGEYDGVGGTSLCCVQQTFAAGGTTSGGGPCVGGAQGYNSRLILFTLLPTTQTAAPIGDVSSGAWVPSAGGTLYGTIDEAVVDDADYDYVTLAAGSTFEVQLTALSDPASATGHIVSYRIAGASGQMTVSLRQGGSTQIATWNHNPVPSVPTTYNQTLSSGEANSITDYTDLRLRFVAAP